jgi:hypothetical protein
MKERTKGNRGQRKEFMYVHARAHYIYINTCVRVLLFIVEFKTPGAGIKREGRKESKGMKEGKAKEWRLKEGQRTGRHKVRNERRKGNRRQRKEGRRNEGRKNK